jgi:hypothetical protein
MFLLGSDNMTSLALFSLLFALPSFMDVVPGSFVALRYIGTIML